MEKYNRLLIIEELEPIIKVTEKRRTKIRMVKCICDCGKEKILPLTKVKNNLTKSCGCYNIEKIIERNTKHSNSIRNSRTPEYISWFNMIQRITNPNNHKYSIYGGRGITMCKEWKEFTNFLKDMGKRPTGTTLDRINVDGDYGPENCKWATPKEQANKRRNNI